MSKKANPAVVGSFVMGAIVLAVAAAVVLGGADLFTTKAEAVAYFDGSVNGLDPGAPVTWQGVRIGSVTRVRMDFDASKHSIRIPVFMEFQPERLHVIGGDPGHIHIKDLVAQGLRAQLQSQSMVTGQLYIDLAMRPDTPAHLQGVSQFLVPEIPTMKSQLDTIEEELERLPLKDLGETALRTLANVDKLVSSPEIKTLLVQLAASAQELQGTLAEVHGQVRPLANSIEGSADAIHDVVQGVGKDVHSTLGEFQQTAITANGAIGGVTKDLHATLVTANESLREAQAALVSVNSLVGANSQQRADINQVLRNLTYTTQALRSFSEQLERNPNALLTGKK